MEPRIFSAVPEAMLSPLLAPMMPSIVSVASSMANVVSSSGSLNTDCIEAPRCCSAKGVAPSSGMLFSVDIKVVRSPMRCTLGSGVGAGVGAAVAFELVALAAEEGLGSGVGGGEAAAKTLSVVARLSIS